MVVIKNLIELLYRDHPIYGISALKWITRERHHSIFCCQRCIMWQLYQLINLNTLTLVRFGKPWVSESQVGLTGKFPMSFYSCGPNFKSLWPPCHRLWLDEFEVLWALVVVLVTSHLRQKKITAARRAMILHLDHHCLTSDQWHSIL